MSIAVVLPLTTFVLVNSVPGLEHAPWAGAAFWLIPSALFFVGAVLAPFNRSVSEGWRGAWAVTSGVCAVLWLPLAWFVGVLLFGP